jgi:hypothetical protein
MSKVFPRFVSFGLFREDGSLFGQPAVSSVTAQALLAGLPPFDQEDLFQFFDCQVINTAPIRHQSSRSRAFRIKQRLNYERTKAANSDSFFFSSS